MPSSRRTCVPLIALRCLLRAWRSPALARRQGRREAGRLCGARRRARVHRRDGARSTASTARRSRASFAEARYQPKIVAAMQRPLLEPPKWYEYAPSFLSRGARRRRRRVLERARATISRAPRQRFGVPAEIIVAILGVETFYGRNTGSYRALDALSTLAFDYPRRAAFFRGELKQFLLLARDLGVPPLAREGIVRRRARRAAVHAGKLSQLRRRLRRRRPRRPVDQPAPTSSAASPTTSRATTGSAGSRCCCRPTIAADAPRRGAAPARRRLERAPAARRVGRRRRDRRPSRRRTSRPIRSGCCCSRKQTTAGEERELLDRVPQLLRAHALQPQPALRGGGVGARPGDPQRACARRRRDRRRADARPR